MKLSTNLYPTLMMVVALALGIIAGQDAKTTKKNETPYVQKSCQGTV